MKLIEDIVYMAMIIVIRTVVSGTFGWWCWNTEWHNWFEAPVITWTQSCGAVFIINMAAGGFRRSQNARAMASGAPESPEK